MSDWYKVCLDCGLLKPIERFYPKKDAKDRHSPYCKDCQKTRSQTARDLRKRMGDWYR